MLARVLCLRLQATNAVTRGRHRFRSQGIPQMCFRHTRPGTRHLSQIWMRHFRAAITISSLRVTTISASTLPTITLLRIAESTGCSVGITAIKDEDPEPASQVLPEEVLPEEIA
jgi:hypothetical protein